MVYSIRVRTKINLIFGLSIYETLNLTAYEPTICKSAKVDAKQIHKRSDQSLVNKNKFKIRAPYKMFIQL